jgi:hypothetical protein
MTIENLTKVIPPPIAPTYRFRGEWESIEARIGLPLPQDYKDLVRLYGSGQFMNFYTVYVPTAPNKPGPFEHAIQAARHAFIYDMQGSLLLDDDPPLPIWPRKGGMLACGETGWGDLLFWLTRGDVSEWPVVIWDREKKTAATFEGDLAGIWAGDVSADCLPYGWDQSQPAFRSSLDV